MFTGIVEERGEVAAVHDDEGGRRLRIGTGLDGLAVGDSLAVSGVCLTVEAREEGWVEVFVASETASKTYLGDLGVGDVVNLERALPADGRLDGHLVQGHVDTTTTLRGREQVGEDWQFTFALPPDHERYVAPRGSVALDGVSLTVADVDDAAGVFEVAVIPETYAVTTLGRLEPGDPVHVEVDVVAKYVERLTAAE